MKKLITIIFAGLLTLNLSAQQFGVKAGLDLTNLNLSSTDTSVTFDMGTGYSAGAFAILELSDVLQLKPELLYSHRTSSSSSNIFGIPFVVTMNYDYIEVPINLGYMVSDRMTINAGPYLGLLLSANGVAEVLGQTEEIDMKEDSNSMDYGMNIGVSYNINESMIINAGYTLGLSNILDDSDSGDSLKWSAIKISFGYIFGN